MAYIRCQETTMTASKEFFEARDLLLRHRTDYDRAYREFTWPVLGNFNWALDYFDVIACRNEKPALWIVDNPEHKGTRLSFVQMSERSARLANFLRGLGVGRGGRLLLMLTNRAGSWAVMLAAVILRAAVLPHRPQLLAERWRVGDQSRMYRIGLQPGDIRSSGCEFPPRSDGMR